MMTRDSSGLLHHFLLNMIVLKLTEREQQLLSAAASGFTDREIGANLSISKDTVSSYWRRILLKFQASSRTECVARYSQHEANQQSVLEKADDVETFVHNLVDQIPIGLVFEGVDQTIEFANRTFLDMFHAPLALDNSVGNSLREQMERCECRLLDQDKFLDQLTDLKMRNETLKGNPLKFVDGRKVESDFIVVSSQGNISGYLTCFREIPTAPS
jgi:DNA-binding CsgD family transcriptional regulator